MLSFVTSLALDVTLGIAWWVTKKITYGTINYLLSPP